MQRQRPRLRRRDLAAAPQPAGAPALDGAAEGGVENGLEPGTARPVLLMGPPGRSLDALFAGIRDVGLLPCFTGGEVLQVLHGIENVLAAAWGGHAERETEEAEAGSLLGGVDRRRLERRLLAPVIRMVEQFAGRDAWLALAQRGTTVAAAPAIARAWPGTRIVWVGCRPLESIRASIRAQPRLTFEQHARHWARIAEPFRDIARAGLPLLQLDERELVTAPAAAVQRLGEFLGWSPAQREQLLAALPAANAAPAPALTTMKWRPEQVMQYRKHCAELAVALGYSEMEEYWLPGAQPADAAAATPAVAAAAATAGAAAPASAPDDPRSVILLTTPTSATGSMWRVLEKLQPPGLTLRRFSEEWLNTGKGAELPAALPPPQGHLLMFNSPRHWGKHDPRNYRFIVNCRDPRDLACNQYHWEFVHPSKTLSAQQLEQKRDKLADTGIDEYVLRRDNRPSYEPVMKIVREATPGSVAFATYALVCLRFDDYLQVVCRFLGIPLTQAVLDATADERPEHLHDNHKWIGRKWAGGDASPGRFRAELKPATIAALNERYRDVLEFLHAHDHAGVRDTYLP